MKITFIGLGIMGSRMAANLLKNNFAVTVFNRSPEPVGKLVQHRGAQGAGSLQEAVSEADLVISMLSNPEVVEQVFLNEEGALAYMKKGSLWMDCSTVNPSFSRKANESAKTVGIRFLDAPVAGTLPHAENAELVFFAGASSDDLKDLQPVFDAMGKKTMSLGEVSKGSAFKMLANVMLAESMLIFSETLLLGEKMGFDKNFLLDVLPNLVVAAPFTKFKAEMIRNGDYTVQFPLELMHKDLHLAATSAYEVGHPLPIANLTKEIFANAKNQGLGRLDFAAIHKYLDKS